MGDKKTLAMARKELEEMYVGVPDDSVNLSFQDLAQVVAFADKKKLSPSSMPPISESHISPANLARLPSLDFNRALQQASTNNHQIHTPHHHHQHHHNTNHHHQQQHYNTNHHGAGFRASPAMDQRSFMSDDMSQVSGMSAVGGGGGGRRRRPGIPHSNICTVCSTYIYIFRNRCLVCGRVYCRQCVAIGMGEMTEGRKCKDYCLGKRFSQKYINKAGNVGCCFGYASTVKQQELKWAEKGPRTRHSMVAPTSRSPRPPPIPSSHDHHSNPPSFIANSPYPHSSPHQFAPL